MIVKNPTAVRHVRTAGNLDTSQAVRMEIDAEGMTVVMSLLSNLYSNGNEAVVREYSCNARDSHVEAGQGRPIEVTLPTILNPQFRVQDWGVGLSREDIFNVYARYGASTKRHTNDQIGAFGIGAKSAFTVGNQFTVTGVQDGQKTIVMFSLRHDGVPTVQELFHGSTDEPNGVLVDVGVENVDAVRNAATKIFSCWQPGTVLVDGEKVETIWDRAEELAPGVYIDLDRSAHSTSSNFCVVMGGVPYDVPAALWNDLSAEAQHFYGSAKNTQVSYILEVPIGAVDITPNREELHITPRTRSTVGRLVELVANSLPGWFTSKIEDAPTIWDAARAYVEINTKLNQGLTPESVYWNGQALGKLTVVILDAVTFILEAKGRYYYDDNQRTVMTDQWATQMKYLRRDGSRSPFSETLFVVGVPENKINTVRAYAKVTMLAARKDGHNYKYLVAVPSSGYRDGWFSVGAGADHKEIDFVTFGDYWANGKRLRKSQVGTSSAPRNKTRYKTLSPGDTAIELRTVDEINEMGTAHVAYSHGFLGDPRNPVTLSYMKRYDTMIVTLNARQSGDVFNRYVPEAFKLNDEVARYAKDLINGFDLNDVRILKAGRRWARIDQSSYHFIYKHRDKILQKDVHEFLEEFAKQITLSESDRKRLDYLLAVYRMAGISNPYEAEVAEEGNLLQERYPLVEVALYADWRLKNTVGAESDQVLIDYINNVV